MIELALFLSLSTSVPELAPTHVAPSQLSKLAVSQQEARPTTPARFRMPPRCDDGSDIFRPDGTPNWECELQGCGPDELTCWSERLDHCYDDSGDDNGLCKERKVTTCNSRWSCFKLWANCRGGEYGCSKSAWPGCGQGSCTSTTLQGSAPKKSASSSTYSKLPTASDVAHPGSRSLPPVRTTGTVGGHDV